jgi:TPR repeat protein
MERYTLCELLGSGGEGKAYRAIRKLDRQLVCLKQIPQDKGPYQQASARNEVTAYKKLSHPNIPTFFESFTEKNVVSVVMELAVGCPLRNSIAMHKSHNESIPESQILHFLGQMVSILTYFKRLSLIYCDLKPDNIIMDQDNDIKLIDYGTAKFAVTKIKKQFTFGGTLAYMSPEMLTDSGYSFETDVWSLGVLLYEMMTLSLPFGSKPEKDVVQKIHNAEPPEINSSCSPGLKNLVRSMLRKRTNARITIDAISKLDFIPRVSTELKPAQWNNIGVKYRFGIGVKKSVEKAVQYFKMAADAGHPDGMFNYCFAIMNSDTMAEALQYLKQAADAGHVDAILNYAISLDRGWAGQPNLREAMRYYRLGADQGNTDAMCRYAVACTEGWDGRPDRQKALRYYRSAADSGSATGMINYANAMATGLSGRPDTREAMRWYQMAADAGNVEAMFSYAVGLERGYLGTADTSAVGKYYKMAADEGHEEAKAALAKLSYSKLPSLRPATPTARR